MIFNQAVYYLLLFVSVAAFFCLPRRWRRLILIISGVSFYGYFAGLFLAVIMMELLTIYFLGYRWSMLVSVGILAFFKYRHMLLFNSQDLAVPLALSFFTFELIHFIIEQRRVTIKRVKIIDLTAFIFFFPTLVAGPIKRFGQFMPQIDKAKWLPENFFFGAMRIVLGLFKKIVLADTLAVFVGDTFASKTTITQTSTLSLWLALFSYSGQILFDFSGYSDMAIGSARLFGIKIPENFIFPYFRSNIAEFWKNWHRTLYTWIVDYIFIPLGGSRGGMVKAIRNTLMAMAISGLWHGAKWHFMAWGIYHGLLLGIYRFYRQTKLSQKLNRIKLLTPVAVLTTFTLVSIGWLFFIAPIDVAILALAQMTGVK